MVEAYRLKDVTFGYGETPVIKGLNLSVPKGALTAVVGPNGSGKSTLLDIMAGYRTPQSGRVTLLGKDLSEHGQRQLARLTAVAPQEFGFTFPFTVREATLMGRHPHIPRFSTPSKQDMTHVTTALEIMDLEQLTQRSVSELSGGERQRTVLARTLAQQAPIMLLDEPTSSLDIRHTLTTMRELKRLAVQEERTVVTVLHDLNLAASFADHVILLGDGAVTAQGAMKETLTPENVRAVFGVNCAVRWDNFARSLSVAYRLEP